MAAFSFYKDGTISVATGATTATGTGTAWKTLGVAGCMLFDKAFTAVGVIASVEDEDEFTLDGPWSGATLIDAPYYILLIPEFVQISLKTAQQLSDLLLQLQTGSFADIFNGHVIGPDLPTRDDYDDRPNGFAYFIVGGASVTYYVRVGDTPGVWSEEFGYGEGPPGPIGPVGATWEGAYDNGTPYVARDIVEHNGSSWVAKISTTGNAPPALPTTSNTQWQLAASKGNTGNDGADPGVLMNFDTATADADPGSGDIRADNVSLASATKLYVSKTSRGGSAIANFLASLDDSTSPHKGVIILTDKVSSAQAIFSLSALTDATNYVKLDVSNHSGATSFANGLAISFQFYRTGQAGAGAGDVVGPAGATANRLAMFDGTTGKLIKQSTLLESDVVDKTSAQTLLGKTLTAPILTLENGAALAPTALARIGINTTNGTLVIGTGSATKVYRAPTQQILTASGTWNRPAGCVAILIEAVGGGGGGGGADGQGAGTGAAGGGGGSGAYGWSDLLDVTSISSTTVVIGSGGAGGVAAGGTGTAGTATTWSDGTNNLSWGGGGGGAGSTGNSNTLGHVGGTGGTTGTGVNGAGQNGSFGVRGATFAVSGAGGSTPLGRGGNAMSVGNAANTGNDGLGYGSGGSGAVSANLTTNVQGGFGQPGWLRVIEFYN